MDVLDVDVVIGANQVRDREAGVPAVVVHVHQRREQHVLAGKRVPQAAIDIDAAATLATICAWLDLEAGLAADIGQPHVGADLVTIGDRPDSVIRIDVDRAGPTRWDEVRQGELVDRADTDQHVLLPTGLQRARAIPVVREEAQRHPCVGIVTEVGDGHPGVPRAARTVVSLDDRNVNTVGQIIVAVELDLCAAQAVVTRDRAVRRCGVWKARAGHRRLDQASSPQRDEHVLPHRDVVAVVEVAVSIDVVAIVAFADVLRAIVGDLLLIDGCHDRSARGRDSDGGGREGLRRAAGQVGIRGVCPAVAITDVEEDIAIDMRQVLDRDRSVRLTQAEAVVVVDPREIDLLSPTNGKEQVAWRDARVPTRTRSGRGGWRPPQDGQQPRQHAQRGKNTKKPRGLPHHIHP